MKKLYSFELKKKETVEEIVIEKNDKGEEIKVLKKVDKNVPYKYFVMKPGRSLLEKAEIYYNKIFWQCQKEGILPLTQLQKRFIDDGGILTQDETEWRKNTYEEVWNKQVAYKELLDKATRTPEEEEKLKSIQDEIVAVWTNIQEFEESKGGSLYQNTAESVAKNRQTLWWAVHLAYQESADGSAKPLFGDGDYDAKLKVYDDYNEGDDEFKTNLVKRFFLIASLWNFGRAQTQEEFDIAVKTAEARGIIDIATVMQEELKNEKTDQAPNETINKLEEKAK